MTNIKARLANMPSDRRRLTLQILPKKLAQSENNEGLYRVLTDFFFIKAKIKEIGIQSLIKDYDLVTLCRFQFYQEQEVDVQLIQKALRLSSNAINDDNTQLEEQLLGRLMSCSSPRLKTILRQAELEKHESSKPWIRHVSPTLNQAQAPLIRTIYGHKNTVETLAITPDGKKIVSGSWDTTIKIWDLFTGEHLKTLNGHKNIVHSVVITSDGQKIVSGASDESIKIWDVNTGEEIKTIESGSINSITVTPDGERIISGSSDKKIRIWDVKTGSLVKIIEGHNDSVDDSVDVVSVSCDGKFIISLAGYTSVVGKGDLHHTDSYHKIGSGSATTKCAFGRSYLNMGVNVFSDTELLIDDASEKPAVKIWDSQTGFPNITLTASKSSFASALALSPDSTKVVAESGRHLKVWNLEKRGNLIKAKVSCYLQGHNRSISDVAIMPDSKYAVSGSHDLTVRVWDLENGKQIKCFTGHSGPVNAVKITPDGKIAVSASADRTIKLWNLAVPPDDKYLDKYKGHERKVTKVKLIDNGRQAISSSWDNKVLVWDVLTGQRVRKIGPFGYFLPPNEAKNYVLNVLKDKDRISSLEDEDKVPDNTHVTRLLLGDAYFDRRGSTVPPIFSLALMPNERGFLACLGTGLMVCDLSIGGPSISSVLYLENSSSTLFSCALTPDASKVIFGGTPSEGTTKKTIDVYSFIRENKDNIRQKDPRTIAVLNKISQSSFFVENDSILRVWNIATGEILPLQGHFMSVLAIEVALNGKIAVSASEDGTLKVWNLDTYQELHTLTGHTSSVNDVVVMPDGYRAISASSDATIRMWNLITGNEIAVLEGHQDSVTSIELSLDGQRLVSVSLDDYLCVWDMSSRKIIARLRCDDHLLTCAIAPNGVDLVAGGESGKVHFLQVQGINPIPDILYEARTFYEAGEYDKAETAYFLALSQKEKLLGPNSCEITFLLREIAEFYLKSCSADSKAVSIFNKVLSVQRQLLGENHFEVAITLFESGNLCVKMKNLSMANTLYKQAIETISRNLARESVDKIDPYKVIKKAYIPKLYSAMANLLKLEGKYEQAKKIYLDVLALIEDIKSLESFEAADVLYELSNVSNAQGLFEESISFDIEANAIYFRLEEKSNSPEH